MYNDGFTLLWGVVSSRPTALTVDFICQHFSLSFNDTPVGAFIQHFPTRHLELGICSLILSGTFI